MANRLWIHVPQIVPGTFVFFFYRNDQRAPGRSWTIRVYFDNEVRVIEAADFRYTHDEIIEMAGAMVFPAEAVNTSNIGHQREETRVMNQRHLGTQRVRSIPQDTKAPPRWEDDEFAFPMLDAGALLRHPKARKRQDMERIRTSPRSEDYVTWNVFALLHRRGLGVWWSELVSECGLPVGWQADHPTVSLWSKVESPDSYESTSRQRMATSKSASWRDRASTQRPVEGETEVDIVLEGGSYLVFVEAKLGSDVSERTTYDPARNQIVRNIDCVLEECGARTPAFWMLVRDVAPHRAYVQLMEEYRRDPERLCQALPHRGHEVVSELATRLRILRWSELLNLGAEPRGALEAAVLMELQRRLALVD